MKKIIILLLLLFNTAAHFLKAQEVTSILTQVTTDLLRGENRNNFNWCDITFSGLGINAYGRQQPCNRYPKGFFNREGTRVCYFNVSTCGEDPQFIGCFDVSGFVPTGQGSLGEKEDELGSDDNNGNGGGGGGNNDDNWNPPPPPPNDQGGGIYDPNDPNNPHNPPPNDPDKDPRNPDKPSDKIGDDPPQYLQIQKLDTVIFKTDSCDQFYKDIVKDIEKDVSDVRKKNGDFDSVYRSASNGYPYELSMTWGRNPQTDSIATTPINTDSMPLAVSTAYDPYNYKTANNLHTHREGTVNAQDLVDVYFLLDQIKQSFLIGDSTTNNTNYIANSQGEIYATSVSSTASVLQFLNKYPPSDNLGPATNGFFKRGTKLEALYRDFYRRATNAGVDKQIAATFGMALLMEKFDNFGMGVDIYKSDGLGLPFYRLSVDVAYDQNNKRYILTLIKCR